MKNKGIICSLLLGFLLLVSGCSEKSKNIKSDKLTIVTTTGMIEDAIKNIVGDKADVSALMGPGVDPHLYKATQGDLKRLMDADIVFYNGLHLEGKMVDILKKLSRQKPVIPVSNGLDKNKLRSPPEFNNNHDPHIWFDVQLWNHAVEYMVVKLAELDKANAETYKFNGQEYLKKLDSLNTWVRDQINTLPKESRVLITAHDAFGYFGDAYGVEVKGLQGISTLSDFGLNDISSLVTMISERKIKAVFVESSVPKKSIEAVVEGCKQRGHEVVIGGTLYSDAMGPKGTEDGTYIGMVKANVNKIVAGLR